MRITREMALCLMLSAASAHAAEQGLYVGLQGGQSDYGLGSVRYPDFFVATENFGDSTAAWGLTAGLRFHRYAALEVNYLNLGEVATSGLQIVEGPPFFRSRPATYEIETTGFAIAGLGILPLTEQWLLHLRAGLLLADTQGILEGQNPPSGRSESLAIGAGVQFNARRQWSVRVEYQRFADVGGGDAPCEADIDLLSLTLTLRR